MRGKKEQKKHVRILLLFTMTGEKMNSSSTTALVRRRREHTYEVVVHGVFGVVLWNGIFSIDNLQFGSVLEWVLLKTQQVEDASKGLHR